jgi:hypothetical protein
VVVRRARKVKRVRVVKVNKVALHPALSNYPGSRRLNDGKFLTGWLKGKTKNANKRRQTEYERGYAQIDWSKA